MVRKGISRRDGKLKLVPGKDRKVLQKKVEPPTIPASPKPQASDPGVYLELLDYMQQFRDIQDRFKILQYDPSGLLKPFPVQYRFHELGKEYRFRLYMAPNQFLGKTTAGAFELAFDLTGSYPDWWPGRRWTRGIKVWACGVSGDRVRDTIQEVLFGPGGMSGKGIIPGHVIVGKPTMAQGISKAIDSFTIQHEKDGYSWGQFKNYCQSVYAHDSSTLDKIWDDEIVPEDIWAAHIARVSVKKGQIVCTASPITGLSGNIKFFWPTPFSADYITLHADLEDNPNLTEEERKQIIANLPASEQRARAHGLPSMGQGLIYPFGEEIFCEPFEVPGHWRKIIGIDFGMGDHPTALVEMVIDDRGEEPICFVTKDYVGEEVDIHYHAEQIKTWGKSIPVAWPHDGMKVAQFEGSGAGEKLKNLYKKRGINMLLRPACLNDGDAQNGIPLTIVQGLIYAAFKKGRLKVFNTCYKLRKEMEFYYRKDGRTVAEKDDAISAMHCAYAMGRYARIPELREAHSVRPVSFKGFNPFAVGS